MPGYLFVALKHWGKLFNGNIGEEQNFPPTYCVLHFTTDLELLGVTREH